ncbi:MAG: hypothetical protein AB8B69_27735 [Chitinophagales bacterium]
MKLNRKQSIYFVAIFGLLTMLGRFYIEPFLAGQYWISVAIGGYCLVILWGLTQKKVLNFEERGKEVN